MIKASWMHRMPYRFDIWIVEVASRWDLDFDDEQMNAYGEPHFCCEFVSWRFGSRDAMGRQWKTHMISMRCWGLFFVCLLCCVQGLFLWHCCLRSDSSVRRRVFIVVAAAAHVSNLLWNNVYWNARAIWRVHKIYITHWYIMHLLTSRVCQICVCSARMSAIQFRLPSMSCMIFML